MYDVYLDDIYFYGVEAFNYPSDRKLTVYNGIGTGYFPKADDPSLKEWSWECILQDFPEHYHTKFEKASSIRDKLNNLLKSKEPSRLVMKSEHSSLSEEVFLENFTFKEKYSGVYTVTVSVTEYKAAAVRTTGIPEIPRPGKIPEVPTFTVAEDETVYDNIPEAEQSWELPPNASPGGGTVTDPQTGQIITLPVDPKPDESFGIVSGTSPWGESNVQIIDKIKDWVSDIDSGYRSPTYEADKKGWESIVDSFNKWKEEAFAPREVD